MKNGVIAQSTAFAMFDTLNYNDVHKIPIV